MFYVSLPNEIKLLLFNIFFFGLSGETCLWNILTMKEPTADKGSGNLLQYIASVTKLMQISVVLIMVTSVGF